MTLYQLSQWEQSAVELQTYQHQEVTIRGFLYRKREGKIILAAEPNLKSCCVGAQNNMNRQVLILGDKNNDMELIALANDGYVKEVRGRFAIEPIMDDDGHWQRLFVLHQAVLIVKSP